MSGVVHLNSRVEVYWESDDDWYKGRVTDYHPSQGWHIQYDDGEREWIPEVASSELVRTILDDDDDGGGVGVDVGGQDNEDDDADSAELEVVSGTDVYRNLSAAMDSPDAKDNNRSITFREDDKAFDDRLGLGRRPAEEKGYDTYDNTGAKGHDDVDADDADDMFGMHAKEDKGDIEIPPGGMVLIGNVMGASNLPPVEAEETDGKCFFRVLYVEGGAKSTMFRCKTPIYSSEVTDDVQYPQWTEGTFRFEMIMPEDAYAGGSGVRLQGQVLVAIYRMRGQGGNEFLGQATFDLGDLVRNGTVETYQPGVDARSLSGSFPLIDRLEKWVGNYAEIRVDLEMAWRPDSLLLNNSFTAPAPPVPRGVGASQAGAGAGTGAGTGAGSRAGTARPGSRVSARPPVAPSKAPTRPTPPAKAGSNHARRNTTEQRRIEADNKALQKRLQASGPKSKAGGLSVLYAPPEAKRSSVSRAGAGSVAVSAAASGPGAGAGAKGTGATLEEVVEVWTRLKKEVGDLEGDNGALRAHLSKLKTMSKKYELSTDRIKRRVGPSAITGGGGGGGGGGGDNAELMSKYLPPSSSRSETSRKRSAEDEDIDAIQDNELKELVLEHQVLQQLRRGVIERIWQAKQVGVEAVAEAKKSQADATALRARIAVLAPYTASSSSSAQGAALPSAEVQELHSLFDRLKNVQLDFHCTEASREHNFHVGPLLDAIHEDRALVEALKRRLGEAKGRLTTLREELDQADYRRKRLADSGEVMAALTRRVGDLRRKWAHLRAQAYLDRRSDDAKEYRHNS
jgi:hypothetical protein